MKFGNLTAEFNRMRDIDAWQKKLRRHVDILSQYWRTCSRLSKEIEVDSHAVIPIVVVFRGVDGALNGEVPSPR